MIPRSRQLQDVLRLLDEAASAQPLADKIIAACGEPSEVAPEFFRAGGRLQVLFYRLRERLDELYLDADLEELRQRGRRLLLYHQWMLREALTVACSTRVRDPSNSRLRINGLGAPADELRELRDNIRTVAETRALD